MSVDMKRPTGYRKAYNPNIARREERPIEVVELSFVTLRGAPSDTGKTWVWSVENKRNQGLVGIIRWFGKWRKYALYPEPETVFEEVCLRELSDFIEARTREWHQTHA